MNVYRYADFHCDVLSKLLTGEADGFDGPGAEALDVTYERLVGSGAALQSFAIYLPQSVPQQFSSILAAVDLFYRRIAAMQGVAFVRTKADLAAVERSGSKLGVMLSLEGADGLQGDLTALRILRYLGVRSLGLTWNHANWAADGALEPRAGGLTLRGRELVRSCNELDIIVDVSHLSERSFWETADETSCPFIASHSNARSICSHPRNLTDDQIRAVIAADGLIGITFVPWFVKQDDPVRPDDLIPHIERICELGGERHLMLASDFDGIDRHIEGLADPYGTRTFIERLAERYGEERAIAFARGNCFRFLSRELPDE